MRCDGFAVRCWAVGRSSIRWHLPGQRHRVPDQTGWSGGPLFTRNSEVCGLLNSSDTQTSVFISCGATREAFNTAVSE